MQQPQPVSLTFFTTPPVCYGGSNGSIQATAANGHAPYTYAWGNGVTGAADTGLAYLQFASVTVTDFLGCTVRGTDSITQQPQPVSLTFTSTPTACYNDNSGSIHVFASNGYAPYSFEWSNGVTGDVDTDLIFMQGVSVTVTDSLGCTVTMADSITQQPTNAPVIQGLFETPPTCYADSNGTINVVATGGHPPYTYLWSNGLTTATDTGLAYLQYAAVTVTDAGGCGITGADSITQQHSQLYTSGTAYQPLCAGMHNGMVDVSVYGGVQPYTYLWSNGGVTENDTNLTAGNYYVTVADANGCSVVSLYVVNQPGQLVITGSAVQNACRDNGNITVAVAGGTGAYNYQWAPPVSTINSAAQLPAGNYGLTVTDANGCFIEGAYIVTGDTAPLQPLCLVSADSTNTGNFVVWQKANKAATDSFFIYRSNAADSNYVEIAALSRDLLSEYDDASANPTITSYRYKMNLLDTCGNYSPLSNYIQTIYLQYSGNSVFVWTPYVVENEASPVSSYSLLRRANGSGNWVVVAASITDTTATDPDFAQYPGASYQVQAVLSAGCNPTRGILTITSNIISKLPTGIISPTATNIQVTAYPNPFNDITNIQITGLTGADKYNFEMYDVTGRLQLSIPSSGANHFQINRGKLAAGIYTYRLAVGEEKATAFGKLVIQ